MEFGFDLALFMINGFDCHLATLEYITFYVLAAFH